jgi:hypothetical protein
VDLTGDINKGSQLSPGQSVMFRMFSTLSVENFPFFCKQYSSVFELFMLYNQYCSSLSTMSISSDPTVYHLTPHSHHSVKYGDPVDDVMTSPSAYLTELGHLILRPYFPPNLHITTLL